MEKIVKDKNGWYAGTNIYDNDDVDNTNKQSLENIAIV